MKVKNERHPEFSSTATCTYTFSSKLLNLLHRRVDSELREQTLRHGGLDLCRRTIELKNERYRVSTLGDTFLSKPISRESWLERRGQLSARYYIVGASTRRRSRASQRPVFSSYIFRSRPDFIYESSRGKFAESNFSRLSRLVPRKLGQQSYR